MTRPSAPTGRQPNRLIEATSPYLLQHAENPVDWWQWGPEALAHARATNKPILLSIGYAACHWCHVMAHESFEDPAIASEMNRLFVNIKVDREERPDIDQIYMAALHALGQQGGWPLTMFLTPDAEPFWGGTYFPPESRWGRPGFPEILVTIARTYHEAPDRITSARIALQQRLRQTTRSTGALDRDLLDLASTQLLGMIDLELGGLRGAPKFPQCTLLDLLWRAARRRNDHESLGAVLTTLRRMCEGGIYDHLGGGFSRYSVDDHWLVPHFEKMLYDNAQILGLLGRSYAETGDDLFRLRIEETVQWLEREMLLPEGAFAASLDADSEGEEGKFYVWSKQEIDAVLGEVAPSFNATYDVTAHGNWEEKTILHRSAGLDHPPAIDPRRFADARLRLLEVRQTRIPPGRDDKILADWNALLVSSLARLSLQFDRTDWLDHATRCYRFIADRMSQNGRLGHSYRNGKLLFPGFASDHANMAAAAIALFEVTGHSGFLDDARSWVTALIAHYSDPESGIIYAGANDAEGLIVRMRASSDEAVPAASGVLAEVLVRLWILTGEDNYRARADQLLTELSGEITRNLFAGGSLLTAFDTRLDPVAVVILEPAGTDAGPLLRAAIDTGNPRIILTRLSSTEHLPVNHPASGKQAVDHQPTAYICRGATCSLPVTKAIHVKHALEQESD